VLGSVGIFLQLLSISERKYMIELRAVKGETGVLLGQLLTEAGLHINTSGERAEAIVSYGVPITSSLPMLNGSAGRINKYEELQRLQSAGVLVPPHALDGRGLTFPILGRKFKHSKAKDIVPILQNDIEFQWRTQGGACDYFVQYIPRRREYRVWSYRRRPIACYEKVMRYPERYSVGRTAGIGWNWGHGFAFEYYREAPEALKTLGAQAVEAVGLDFGAVDIIHGMDDQLYTLEVNSAPGVQQVRHGIAALAKKIVKWHNLGYPARKGTRDAE
jgi:hypothetical protein